MSKATPDEVYSDYGRAMFTAQLIEQDVENFAWALLRKDGEAGRKQRDWLEGQTLGAIWRSIDSACRDADEVWAGNIKVFIRTRNYLAHHFYLDAKEFTTDDMVCAAAIDYLRDFDKTCAVAAYHLRLLIEALDIRIAARFPMSVERSLAARKGVDETTTISFRSFSGYA